MSVRVKAAGAGRCGGRPIGVAISGSEARSAWQQSSRSLRRAMKAPVSVSRSASNAFTTSGRATRSSPVGGSARRRVVDAGRPAAIKCRRLKRLRTRTASARRRSFSTPARWRRGRCSDRVACGARVIVAELSGGGPQALPSRVLAILALDDQGQNPDPNSWRRPGVAPTGDAEHVVRSGEHAFACRSRREDRGRGRAISIFSGGRRGRPRNASGTPQSSL